MPAIECMKAKSSALMSTKWRWRILADQINHAGHKEVSAFAQNQSIFCLKAATARAYRWLTQKSRLAAGDLLEVVKGSFG